MSHLVPLLGFVEILVENPNFDIRRLLEICTGGVAVVLKNPHRRAYQVEKRLYDNIYVHFGTGSKKVNAAKFLISISNRVSF